MSDVSATLAERGGRYGKFADHAAIAQGIQEVLHRAPNWSKLDPDMRQAMCVIADKMARILNGDPYYDDNWHDIQGYAKLVEDRIKEMVRQEAEAVRLVEEAKREEIMQELADDEFSPAEVVNSAPMFPPFNPLGQGGTALTR